MMWGPDGNWGWMGMGWWMMVPLLLLLLALVVVAVWGVVTMTGGRPRRREAREEPERILAERFARGEIDEEEYRRRLDVLRGDMRPGERSSRPPGTILRP